MNNTKRDTLIWSLGAVLFSLIGVQAGLTASGKWYLILGTICHFVAAAAFAAKAIQISRSTHRT